MTPGNAEHEHAEDLADLAAAENPDPQTRRETLELHLQDEDISEEGERVEVNETDD
ncbi:MAG TPA: hypothetical protein VHC63_08465 [Acidimicrobiales bacterium]|nr:hypothetical protein [Acidimicrobiales bacterium]